MSDYDFFALKRVPFLGKYFDIILQASNGPCPLIAAANVLILTQRISLDAPSVAQRFVLLADLVQMVADVVLLMQQGSGSSKTRNNMGSSEPTDEFSLNDAARNMLVSSVFELLPKLSRGLDLNIKFTGCSAMEFTEELSVFDYLGISLVHGWLIDPQLQRYVDVIGDRSYNQIMYELAAHRGSLQAGKQQNRLADAAASCVAVSSAMSVAPSHSPLSITPPAPADVTDLTSGPPASPLASPNHSILPPNPPSNSSPEALRAIIIEEFLAESASQLTYIGLVELHQAVKERQMAVLFRNNHFSTIYRHEGDLYILVTDAGFADQACLFYFIPSPFSLVVYCLLSYILSVSHPLYHSLCITYHPFLFITLTPTLPCSLPPCLSLSHPILLRSAWCGSAWTRSTGIPTS